MAATTEGVNQDIADISSTSSGLIEKASLQPILVDIAALLVAYGIATPADVTALQALKGAEVAKAFVPGVGFFVFNPTAPVPIPAGSYAALGGGYWKQEGLTSVASLLDVVLTSPQAGEGLLYNDSTGKFENGLPSLVSFAWAGLTGVPAAIAAVTATQFLVKHFNDTTNKSIGTAARGNGNVTLAPLGHVMAAGTNSFVYTAKNIPHMISVIDSLIATSMTEFRTSADDFTVERCVIIGDPGPLDAYFNADLLADLVIIGSGGVPTYIKQANGEVTIQGDPAGTPVITLTDPVSIGGPVTANNNLLVVGNTSLFNTTISGAAILQDGVDITGTMGISGPIRMGSWTTGTRPATGGGFPMGFNTTLAKMEYYNGTTWVPLP